jgi:HTH-type transcriptional regulator/antitoxin HipB
VNTDTTRRGQIISSLSSKEAREAFVASRIRVRVPAQIREMRLGRGWSQADLGSKAGMKQTAISRCESRSYEAFTLTTLRALAAAFDVGLKVEFVPFGELVDNATYPPLFGLDVPCFALDVRLGDETAGSEFAVTSTYRASTQPLPSDEIEISEITGVPGESAVLNAH